MKNSENCFFLRFRGLPIFLEKNVLMPLLEGRGEGEGRESAISSPRQNINNIFNLFNSIIYRISCALYCINKRFVSFLSIAIKRYNQGVTDTTRYTIISLFYVCLYNGLTVQPSHRLARCHCGS